MNDDDDNNSYNIVHLCIVTSCRDQKEAASVAEQVECRACL